MAPTREQLEQLTDQELAALISDLTAIRAARLATSRQTRVEHHAGEDGGD